VPDNVNPYYQKHKVIFTQQNNKIQKRSRRYYWNFQESGFSLLLFNPDRQIWKLTTFSPSLFLTYCLLLLIVVNFSLSREKSSQADRIISSVKNTASQDSVDVSENSLSSPPLRWHSMIGNIPGDWKQWATISFTSDKINEWAVIGGMTALLIATDDITYAPSRRYYESSVAGKYWSEFFSKFGDGRAQFTLAGSFGAFGLLGRDQKALRTGSQIVEVVLASGAVVQILKHITGRESPFVRTSPTGIWRFLPNQIQYHKHVPHYDAFPSGHICTSLATVVVIAENYPDQKWISPLGYGITSLIGIGMVNKGIHWYSDYPLGLFLGYYFGKIVSHPDGFDIAHTRTHEAVHLSLSPHIDESGTGIQFTLQF
jgi:hypothetical protein